uniref:Phytocyanin domain-containing protein n=1 Tax=Oryza punctata TaxID=4537 RepID=A0A0E0LT47_ORYPU
MAAMLATVLCAALAVAVADARDHVVGGNHGGGWKVPAQPDALNRWAEATRFHVGDNLVFKFDGAADAVLEVTRDDYNRCGTGSPVATYKPTGGAAAATVPLTRSGYHFFVGATPGSCDKGERVIVLVMSEKHSRRGQGFFAPVPAPAMAPAQSPLAAGLFQAPAPAPATGNAGRTAASGAMLVAALLGAAAVAGF